MRIKIKNAAAVSLGALGGRQTWRRGKIKKMREIVRNNGKKGGRPKKTTHCEDIIRIHNL